MPIQRGHECIQCFGRRPCTMCKNKGVVPAQSIAAMILSTRNQGSIDIETAPKEKNYDDDIIIVEDDEMHETVPGHFFLLWWVESLRTWRLGINNSPAR